MLKSDKIDIACNYPRVPYSILDTFFNTKKCGEIDIKDKFIIIHDMSYTLSFLEGISGLKDSDYSDAEEKEDTIIRLVYGILNSLAHYRHYTTSRLKRNSVLILYASNSSHYVRYAKTFKIIQKILNLFKKTIFIERLEDETKFIYDHLAYFTAMNVFSMNSQANRRCRIMYIGNNELTSQMLRIDRDMISIRHKYVDCGPDIIFKSDVLFLDPISISIDVQNIDLITSLLSILGFKHGYPRLESIKHKRSSSIYDIVLQNVKTNSTEFPFGIDKEDHLSIIKGIGLSQSDCDLFNLRLRMLDIDFQNKIFILSKTLLKIWSSKIETKGVHNFNDFIENDDVKLNVNWLIV